MSAHDPIIKVDGVWKRYGLPLAHWLGRLRGVPIDDPKYWALRNLSFEVQRGETLGIIGRNGAGKSTLLKVLSGVTPPTRGDVAIRGRVFPMIELNAGVHPELTGRENVRFLGTLMGIGGREMRAKLPAIEDFAELGEWFDRPVRQYSSGMQARLGFAVAMNVDADILLIDEVLSVGDIGFQGKCLEWMHRLSKKNVTVAFVTHNVRQAERICDSGIFLESGTVRESGDISDIAGMYLTDSISHASKNTTPSAPSIFHDIGEVTITDIALLDHTGTRKTDFECNEEMRIRMEYKLARKQEGVIISFGFVTMDQVRITDLISVDEPLRNIQHQSGCVECQISSLSLMPGQYGLYLSISIEGQAIFKADHMITLAVHDPSFHISRRHLGYFTMKHTWRSDIT